MSSEDAYQKLSQKLDDRTVLVGIIGMGYVGLPLALAFVERAVRVLGFDVDPTKTRAINDGRDYIAHIGGGRLARAVQAEGLSATSDLSRLDEPDVLLICVPTPLTKHRDPDMSFVEATADQIGGVLRPGQLVVLESTTYPGTTDDLLRRALEKRSGLVVGRDFFLAYSPEREDPGNPNYETSTIPKVVGGFDAKSGELARRTYNLVIERTVLVSSAKAAEASKLTENIFRAVNIALVNELKIVYDRMGIDVWEVLDAAETKPFGFMRFNPGPGWGGHCIPVDPFYLSWVARRYGLQTKFIERAGELNADMPSWVVGKLRDALNDRGKAVRGAKILLLGMAYKKNVDDCRESPSFEILHELIQLGAEVSYHDPHVIETPEKRDWPKLQTMRSIALTEAAVQAVDAVVLVTDHDSVDYGLIRRSASLIVDARGRFRPRSPNVVPA